MGQAGRSERAILGVRTSNISGSVLFYPPRSVFMSRGGKRWRGRSRSPPSPSSSLHRPGSGVQGGRSPAWVREGPPSLPGATHPLFGGWSAVNGARFLVFRASRRRSSIGSEPASFLVPSRGGRSQKRASGPRTAPSRTIVSHPNEAGVRPSHRPPTSPRHQGRNMRDARTGRSPSQSCAPPSPPPSLPPRRGLARSQSSPQNT